MTSWLLQIGLSGKLLNGLALIVTAVSVLTLPGPVKIETKVTFFENTQWQVVKTLEIAPDVWTLVENDDASVEELTRQLDAYRTVADNQVDFIYNEATRSEDNWTVVTVASNSEGYATLNELFFDNQATITRNTAEQPPQVSLVVSALDPAIYTTNGGSVLFSMTGASIIQSNADQTLPTGNTANWTNPAQMNVTLTEIAGDPSNVAAAAGIVIAAEATPAPKAQPIRIQQVGNVIRNGDFELPFDPDSNGVAPEWEGYDNGQSDASWYEELWPEAVHRDMRAQLMEIFEVEPNILDRVIAIYQTVDVEPNSIYDLELYAILRSDADEFVRNRDEIEMHWGIDPLGEGNYDNVEEWIRMPLTEQTRLGSTGEFPEDIPLVYERITGTVTISDTSQITLFIRGLKKFPNNVEALYDVDDVSLTGPVMTIMAQPTAVLTENDTNLPSSGAELYRGASTGVFAIGGIVLVILGAAAAVGVMGYRRRAS